MSDIQKFIEQARTALNKIQSNGQNLSRDNAKDVIVSMKDIVKRQDEEFNARKGSAIAIFNDSIREFDLDDEGLTDEDYVDYIDTIYDILAEVENNRFEDVHYEIKTNMSPNLLRLFGRKEGFEKAPVPADWERPKTYGLGNSAPIIPDLFKNLTLKKFVKHVKVQLGKLSSYDGPKRERHAISTFQSVKSYVEDAYATGLFGEESAIANLKEAMEMISDDSQDLDDDDIEECVQLIREYIDDIEVDFVNDADYEMPENISANLKRLFGHDGSAKGGTAVDWKPPSTHGLGNSDPIIRPKHTNGGGSNSYNNANASSKKSTDQVAEPKAPPYQPSSTSTGMYQETKEAAKKMVEDIQSKAVAVQSQKPRSALGVNSNGSKSAKDDSDEDEDEDESEDEQQQQQREERGRGRGAGGGGGGGNKQVEEEEEDDEEEDSDEEESDDDDDDEDEDEDAISNRILKTSNMSVSLMKALGMDVSDKEVKTDWKPPTQAGMTNSKRLV